MKVSDKASTENLEGIGRTQNTKNKKGAGKTDSREMISTSGELSSSKVKLSERAQDMKKIKEAVNKTPDVDEAKVAKFKALINNGEYKVDSKKVANKLVDEYAYGDVLTKDE